MNKIFTLIFLLSATPAIASTISITATATPNPAVAGDLVDFSIAGILNSSYGLYGGGVRESLIDGQITLDFGDGTSTTVNLNALSGTTFNTDIFHVPSTAGIYSTSLTGYINESIQYRVAAYTWVPVYTYVPKYGWVDQGHMVYQWGEICNYQHVCVMGDTSYWQADWQLVDIGGSWVESGTERQAAGWTWESFTERLTLPAVSLSLNVTAQPPIQPAALTPVPLPPSIALMGLGVAGIGFARRRQAQA